MVTKEKLAFNLDVLRKHIPQKPKEYTSDHPVTIKEALEKYSNQRSINGIQSLTKLLDEKHWSLPLWINPHDIEVGFFNKLYYKRWFNSTRKAVKKKIKFKGLKDFEYLRIPFINEYYFKINFDDTIIEAFEVNRKYIEQRLKSNPILVSKKFIIEEIFKTYKKKYWTSCINTLFPLLDFVARKLLKTKNLGVDISKICKLFEQNGFALETADHLMPHITLINASISEKKLSKEEYDILYKKVKDNDFGIIGPALSSFIRFANHYYGYYKEDGVDSNIINRHAILHGSINSFGNKTNVVKLITFLFLMLELEPVFKILFNDE